MSRRHVTTAVTLVVLCTLLVIAAVVGWQSLFAPIPEGAVTAATPSPSCTSTELKPGQKIKAAQVKVSVFNAGSTSGLADETMDRLTRRGFRAGEVGNAPAEAKVRRAVVWSTRKDDVEARLVARQLGKKVKVKFSDVDLGPGVDVIVGDRFRKLVKAPRTITVDEPQTICVSPSASPKDDAGTGAAA
jgi:hypothetical protein